MEKMYSSSEVARMLHRSVKTITAQSPKYATMCVGRRWLWTEAAVHAYKQKLRNRKEAKE